MDAESIRVDVREFLTVVALAMAGLALAAVAAFTPWYSHGTAVPAVTEMYGPAVAGTSNSQP